jgi:hypothetical protein
MIVLWVSLIGLVLLVVLAVVVTITDHKFGAPARRYRYDPGA